MVPTCSLPTWRWTGRVYRTSGTTAATRVLVVDKVAEREGARAEAESGRPGWERRGALASTRFRCRTRVPVPEGKPSMVVSTGNAFDDGLSIGLPSFHRESSSYRTPSARRTPGSAPDGTGADARRTHRVRVRRLHAPRPRPPARSRIPRSSSSRRRWPQRRCRRAGTARTFRAASWMMVFSPLPSLRRSATPDRRSPSICPPAATGRAGTAAGVFPRRRHRSRQRPPSRRHPPRQPPPGPPPPPSG